MVFKTRTPFIRPEFQYPQFSNFRRQVSLFVPELFSDLDEIIREILEYVRISPDLKPKHGRVSDHPGWSMLVMDDCKFSFIFEQAIDATNYDDIQIKEKRWAGKIPKIFRIQRQLHPTALRQAFWYVKFRKRLDFHLRANPLLNFCETDKSEIKCQVSGNHPIKTVDIFGSKLIPPLHANHIHNIGRNFLYAHLGIIFRRAFIRNRQVCAVYSSSRNRRARSGNGLLTHNNIKRPGQTQTATNNTPTSSPRQTTNNCWYSFPPASAT